MFRRLFLACVVLSASALAQTPQFTIQDLGALPNLPACTATGLSQSGNVTGFCQGQAGTGLLNGPATHGFLYSKGALTDLNLTAQPTPLPMAVNDSGLVTGAYLNISIANRSFSAAPFIVQPNGSQSQLPGSLQALLPWALNNAGQLVGSSVEISGNSLNLFINSEAVVYPTAGGATTVLAAPPGAGTAAAFGVNSNGTVPGASVSANGSQFLPLLWQNAKPQALPVLSGYPESSALSVNDSGAAAGAAFSIDFDQLVDPNASSHAVLFNTDGTVTDLGVLTNDLSSLALGINNAGSVVGFSDANLPNFTLQLSAILNPPGPGYRAFFYTNGKMYDLNTLLMNGTGWSLSFATAINNAGQITGTGRFQGPNGGAIEQHGFLLTPVAPAAGPTITSVVGAGLSTPAVTSISTNGLFTIFGSDLAAAPAGLTGSDIVNNQLPTDLGNTCVRVGAAQWGLFYVSPGQINALAGEVPSSGSVSVQVITNCGTANEIATVVNVPVAAASPEFLYFVTNANGQNPVATIQQNGAYVGAPGLIAGATFTPAQAEDVLTAFGVGWGATSSSAPAGTIASAAAALTSHYTLTLGGAPVNVSYAGLSPGFAGLYQVNFTVPSGLMPGNQALVLNVGGASTPSEAYITVGN
jgi:uncharacterized protein (TIGR03437 family)